MSRELTTGDLATRHNVDRKTAYRWMKAVHAEFGPTVVSRRGKRGIFVTTEDAWQRVQVLVKLRQAEEQWKQDVELRLQILEERQDRASVDVTELYRRSQVHRPTVRR